MTLPALPAWFWPALAAGAFLFYLVRQHQWPFERPRPADPLAALHQEILRGVLAKHGILPPISAPASPRVIELPMRFVIVPMEEQGERRP